MSDEKLTGQLKKLGVKGPRRTWKKRHFVQKDNKLYYYIHDKTHTPQGFISLEDALGVDATVDTGISGKRNFCFQINTPKRIYHLQADSEDTMKYWVDGVNRILQKIHNKDQPPSDSMTSKQLERAENRIDDLEEEVKQLRAALGLACKELKTTPEKVMVAAAEGQPLNVLRSDSFEEEEDTAKQEQKNEEEQKAVKSEEKETAEAVVIQEKEPETVVVEKAEEKQAPLDDDDSADESSDEEVADPAEGKDHFPARVLYEYSARKNYELSIEVEEVITVLSKHENGWWLGCNRDGKQGYFPGSYVEPVSK